MDPHSNEKYTNKHPLAPSTTFSVKNGLPLVEWLAKGTSWKAPSNSPITKTICCSLQSDDMP